MQEYNTQATGALTEFSTSTDTAWFSMLLSAAVVLNLSAAMIVPFCNDSTSCRVCQTVSQAVSLPVNQSVSLSVCHSVPSVTTVRLVVSVSLSVNQSVSLSVCHSVPSVTTVRLVVSVSQSISQLVSQPVCLSFSPFCNGFTSCRVSQSVSQSVSQPVCHSVPSVTTVRLVCQSVNNVCNDSTSCHVCQSVAPVTAVRLVVSVSQPVTLCISVFYCTCTLLSWRKCLTESNHLIFYEFRRSWTVTRKLACKINVVSYLLGNLPASELLVPTFRNFLSAPFSLAYSVEVIHRIGVEGYKYGKCLAQSWLEPIRGWEGGGSW